MNAVSEINGIKHLPPLSATASRLMQLVSDDDVDLRKLSEVIEQDPGLAARVIGLANSAYFCLTQPVHKVEEAIIRVLGLNTVKSLALGIAVAGAFNVQECEAFDLTGYWYRALASAQLARLLAMQVARDARPDPDSVHLGGLFHNLGSLLLAHAASEEYAMVIQSMNEHPSLNRMELENEVMGIDAIAAGQLLAKRWHLPEPVAVIMSKIGDREFQGPYELESCLVNAAVDRVGMDGKGGISLEDDAWLLQLPGMDKKAVAGIEKQFLGQCEQLQLVALSLS